MEKLDDNSAGCLRDEAGRVIFQRIVEDGLITEERFTYDEAGDKVLVSYFEEMTPFDEEDYYENEISKEL